MTTINLNQKIKVSLTNYGKECYIKYLSQFHQTTEKNLDEPFEIPFWEFSQIFGPFLYNGNPRIITVDNSIELV